MKTFALLLVIYALGGFWYATYDASQCPQRYDWTLACLPGQLPVMLWVGSLIFISLFVMFVFPGFNMSQSRSSALVTYIWMALALFVVYKLVSMATLAFAGGGR